MIKFDCGHMASGFYKMNWFEGDEREICSNCHDALRKSFRLRIFTCGHDLKSSTICIVVPSETEDWIWVNSRVEVPLFRSNPSYLEEQKIRPDSMAHNLAIGVAICGECKDQLPSVQARKDKAEAVAATAAEKDLSDEEEKLQDALDGGYNLFKCEACETLWPEDDLIQIRECPHCTIFFNGTDNGRNCEDCNRPFTSKITERGCPDCVEEQECTEINVEAEIKVGSLARTE